MNNSKYHNWILRFFVLATFLLTGSQIQADEINSVQQFLEMKPDWDQLVQKKNKLKIEGRITSFSNTLILFRNCKIPFRSSIKKRPRSSSKSRTIEVHGYLKLKKRTNPKDSDEVKHYFEVNYLRAIPSDIKSFESKKRFLDKDNLEGWIKLGQWALKRSEFYEDEELKKAGEDALFQALLIEKEQIPKKQYKLIFNLIQKIEKQDFDTISTAEEIRIFRHEAYRRWWNEIKSNNFAEVNLLKKEIEKNLDGVKTPLTPKEYKQKETYDKDPVQVYNQAEPLQRKILHRLFYTDILYETILSKSDPDGENGYEIAKRIEKDIPEIKDLPEKLRVKELDYKIKRIQTFTRGQLLDLAKKLDDRNETDEKKRILNDWLELRTKNEKAEGPAGLILIARDYLLLLNDKKSAYEILLVAYEMNPKSEETAQQLRKLGYEFQKGQWIPVSEVEPTQLSKIQESMRSGEVVVEMTTDQVTKTLGKPDTVTKAISANEIDIIWTFGKYPRSRLVIHFIKKRNNKKAIAKVKMISQTRGE